MSSELIIIVLFVCALSLIAVSISVGYLVDGMYEDYIEDRQPRFTDTLEEGVDRMKFDPKGINNG